MCTQLELRGVVRSARSGRRSSSAGPCVCGSSNVGHSFIVDYRAGRPVSPCSAVGAVCVWPCPRHAISRYRQLRRSAMTLMTSATTAAVASLDRASPRVHACIYVYIDTVQYSDCVPPCAPCRQCMLRRLHGRLSVSLSVYQRRLLLARGVRADSMRTCVVLQIYEWSRVQAAARSRSLY